MLLGQADSMAVTLANPGIPQAAYAICSAPERATMLALLS